MNNSPIKVVYITKSLPSQSESFVVDLMKWFSCEKNFESVFVGLGNEQGIVGQVKVHPIGGIFDKYILRVSEYFSKFQKLEYWRRLGRKQVRVRSHARLSEILKKYSSEIAYIDYGTIGVEVYEVLKKNNIPYIVHLHGYDASLMLEGNKDPDYPRRFVDMANGALAILVPSGHLRRRVILAGANHTNILTCPYSPNFEMIGKCRQKEPSPMVLALGRLTSKKNPIATLHAFSLVRHKIPEAHLHLIGDGPLRDRVEKEVDRLDLRSHVTLHGALSREVSFPLLARAHVFVQHSVTAGDGDQEGFPVALAEAAAHALPIVSTIHSGIVENVVDGQTGYLVQEHDFESMAEKIIHLLKNPKLASQMGEAGEKRIRELCDPERRRKIISSCVERGGNSIRNS